MTIDLLAYHIRIYGRWVQKKHRSSIPAMFEIVDRIALHIKNMVKKKD
jgi:hypothetical protein